MSFSPLFCALSVLLLSPLTGRCESVNRLPRRGIDSDPKPWVSWPVQPEPVLGACVQGEPSEWPHVSPHQLYLKSFFHLNKAGRGMVCLNFIKGWQVKVLLRCRWRCLKFVFWARSSIQNVQQCYGHESLKWDCLCTVQFSRCVTVVWNVTCTFHRHILRQSL